MFLTHSSRAAVNTILAQSRTSTRRLVPQLQHVISRGRVSVLATPVCEHTGHETRIMMGNLSCQPGLEYLLRTQ
jgi:hypothetical protein